jgi:hypothetical protein
MYNDFDKVLKSFQAGGSTDKPFPQTATITKSVNGKEKLNRIREQERQQLAAKKGKTDIKKQKTKNNLTKTTYKKPMSAKKVQKLKSKVRKIDAKKGTAAGDKSRAMRKLSH